MSLPPGFWREAYEELVQAYRSGAWVRFSSYTVAGRVFNYRNYDEFKKILADVKKEADLQDGTPPFRGRTCAGNRGRG